MIWRCASFKFDTKMPILMGILNVTPDSFSDGGEHVGLDDAVAHAMRMVGEGAAIIDVGGESTRPGAAPVSIEEELSRTIEVVKALAGRGVCVSIDTRHADVARAAICAGAAIINDVSGFRDAAMIDVARECSAGVVIMHMQGEPATMNQDPLYRDVVDEVRRYLHDRALDLEAAGIDRERICVDPGPGFGKGTKQTIEVVRNFQEFVHLGYPVMAALSRKSYLGYAYGIDDPKKRDGVSATEALMAVELGASVVRTHNVAETAKALQDVRPAVLLGLGCNVPLVAEAGEERAGKIAMLNQAIAELCTLPDSQIIDISSFYESQPAYYEDQDTFVNAVMLLRTGLPPAELLTYLHAIENSLGRVRDIENGPRTCDIDIIDYQLYVVTGEVLVLPHPRALERDFVVQPLLEICPRHVLADGTPVTTSAVSVGKATRL